MRRTAVIRTPNHVPLVHVVRAGLVEGVHHGSVVVLDADGEVELEIGDIDAAFYPRSAMKPIQAVGMLRAGLPLRGRLLALGAASHSGEEFHVDGVRRILDLAGLDVTALRNPRDLPYERVVRDSWIANGRRPSQLAQVCSGKHAAMVVTAALQGWPRETYLDPEHPLQQVIAGTVEELTDERIAGIAVDGCGAPLFSVSLLGLTRAIARIAKADQRGPERAVAAAFRAHPDMVAGSRRDVSRLMREMPGLIAKDGLEGVHLAALPDGRAVGVKIADGAERARIVVAAAALARCGLAPTILSDLLSATVPVGGVCSSHLEIVGPLGESATFVDHLPRQSIRSIPDAMIGE